MLRAIALAATLLLLPVLGRGAEAQQRLCDINAPGRTTQSLVGADTIVVLHDPFTVTCSDGALLQANSGRLNRAVRDLVLTGDVFFQDSIQSLTSDRATYNSAMGRLHATGNVIFTNRQEGSTLTGPELEYFRATDDRPLSQVTAGQRPTLILQPRDTVSAEEPLNVVADRVLIVGEDDLTATGDVVITRTDLTATAGEARYNSVSEDLELRQNALLRSEEYTLAGEVVQARMVESSLEHVHARTNASLLGEDLEVTAPDLQLFFADDLIQRAVAVAPRDSVGARARATSRAFRMEADSLDATFTAQRLEQVLAVGRARAESIDTLAADAPAPQDSDSIPAAVTPMRAGPEVLAHDWIKGDTIIGHFEPADADSAELTELAQPEDTAVAPDEDDDVTPVELRRLVAMGGAQSLYRMTPEEERGNPGARQNVNFLVGERIELELEQSELRVAQVQGLQQGVYMEALPREAPPAAEDEMPAPPDTPEPLPDSPAPDAAFLSTGGDDA